MGTESRTYERTHPWIRFGFDLSRLGPATWIGIGKAQALCGELRQVPMLPAAAQKLHEVYLTRGVLATTAIEGNTLTEDEVLGIVRGQLELPISLAYQQREVENVLAAYNEVAGMLADGALRIDAGFLLHMNERILRDLELDEGVVPGRIREGSVVVGGGVYRGPPHEDCRYLLRQLTDWLDQPWYPEDAFVDGLAKAIVGHLYLAWIHPFDDGNGRTARLLELALLLRVGVPAPAAHLFSNHYNRTRSMYYRRLADASRSRDGESAFFAYALQGFVDGLDEQLTRVLGQHRELVWERLVADRFGDDLTVAQQRQRAVALALPEELIPRAEVPDLTPGITRGYAGKGTKTQTRDLNRLFELGLVELTAVQVRATRELVDNLMPIAAEEET